MKASIIQNKKSIKLLAILFWIVIWQVVAVLVSKELLIASPVSVLKAIASLSMTASFWGIIATSLFRIIAGFLLGISAGTVIAVLSSKSKVLRALMSPLVSIIKTTPVASFIIIALIWIKAPFLSVFISFLTVMPVAYFNMYEGICGIDLKLRDMADVFEIKKSKRFFKIYLPSVMPFLLSSVKMGLGFAWKSGIAAEVIAIPLGTIGKEIRNAKIYLETPELFAWTAVVIILSFAVEKGFVFILEKLIPCRIRTGGEKS